MINQVKILIIGPIADFGGREVEAKILANSFVEYYAVNFLSTIHMTEKSYALLNHKNFTWSNVSREIYKEHLLIRLSSKLTKFLNGRVDAPITFMGNKVTHQLYDFNKLYLQTIQSAISENDVIVFCGDFQSKWLKEIVNYSFTQKKKFLFRTTGTIYGITDELKSIFKNDYRILVHSKLNSLNADKIWPNNKTIIDQTTLNEGHLLKIPLDYNKNITYGYLGRFGNEKGILELLQITDSLRIPIIFAGDGPFKSEVIEYCSMRPERAFIGKLKSEEITTFFSKIDVLIIPSLEEAGPLVSIEAMAAGKIIISTKVGATQERLEDTDNQFWFDINDPQSLLDTIKSVESLYQDELVRVKRQVRERYLAKYSNAEIASQYIRVVKELLN